MFKRSVGLQVPCAAFISGFDLLGTIGSWQTVHP